MAILAPGSMADRARLSPAWRPPGSCCRAQNPVRNVFARNGKVFADSRDVAAFFDKRHYHVLQVIDDLTRQAPDLRLRDFTETTYTVETGIRFSESFNNLAGAKTYRCVHMTRDGFALLAFGFTVRRT